jgi:uncharacterized protein
VVVIVGIVRHNSAMTTIILLIISNIFMTIAWYGHLRFPGATMTAAIFVSWGIALVEYCFAVPANRIGFAHGFSSGQLKIIQEIVSLSVFFVFAAILLKEPIGLRHIGAFLCMVGAAAFMFVGRS